MRAALRTLVKSDSGVTALEYALILAIIAVVIITAVIGIGGKLGQNFEIIAAAVSDQPVPGDDASAPGDGDGTTVSDPPRQATAPVADGGAPDQGGENSGGENAGGGNAGPTDEDGPAVAILGGENIGQGAGAVRPSDTAVARSAAGAGAGTGGTGNSASGASGSAGRSRGGDTGNAGAGAGLGRELGQAGPGEAGAVLGWAFTSDGAWDTTTFWDQSAALAPSATAVSGENQSTGRTNRAGGESDLKSTLIALLGLILGLVVAFLGWKKTLQATAQKDTDEQLESWEPASFGEISVPRPV